MSETLVANELLAFLQQKLDVMDEVSAVQICVTNFSEDDIAEAKVMLYESLGKRDQMVSRRREGTKRSLQDIVTLLKETDPDHVPTYVARNLNKLPPVTFDHVDVTCLLKDITLMKASLADVQQKLTASETTVTALRKELEELRNTVTVTGSPAHVNKCRGAALDVSGASFASAVLHSHISSECDDRPLNPAPAAPPRDVTRPPDPLSVPTASAKPRPPIKHGFAKVTESTPAPKQKPVSETAPNRADDDGFVTVERRKRRHRTVKNCCGKAPVELNATVRAAKPNTPVYVSRLHYTTKAEDIGDYIRRKTSVVMRVQLLESRRNVNFKSFVVRVPTCVLDKVMDENFWPKDVVFRRFRGQLPTASTTK